MGTINEVQQLYKNEIEISMYAPSPEIKTIVYLIRELINLVTISIEPKNPWNEARMNVMLGEIVQLVGYQIEQIEGIICLADTNLYHYTSAYVISRTVLEINVVIEWLLNPEDNSEIVLRYIRYLKAQLINIDTYNNYIKSNSILPKPVKDELSRDIDKIIKDIREMTQAAINSGISSAKISDVLRKTTQAAIDPSISSDEVLSDIQRFPSFKDMLEEISPEERQNRLKITYYAFSKFTHSMRHSINRYHKPNFPSYEPVPDWEYPLNICYESIIASTRKLLKRFQTDDLEQFDINLKTILKELEKKMNKAFPRRVVEIIND